jgi:hypothetical protein
MAGRDARRVPRLASRRCIARASDMTKLSCCSVYSFGVGAV